MFFRTVSHHCVVEAGEDYLVSNGNYHLVVFQGVTK